VISVVLSHLTPEAPAQVPEGAKLVESTILGGLPHRVALGSVFALTMTLPNGMAKRWLDLDPAMVVSDSQELTRPGQDGGIWPGNHTVLRPSITLLNGARRAAMIPAVVGVPMVFCGDRDDSDRIQVEVTVLSWLIHAGTVRGAGDYGSRISVAWRPADQGSEAFEVPPVHPYLQRRLPAAEVLESEVGWWWQRRRLNRWLRNRRVR
jgi:hypothetical protein